jgi:hypothetical protein
MNMAAYDNSQRNRFQFLVAGLVSSGNTLSGTTPYGGSSVRTVSDLAGSGTVFAVNADGPVRGGWQAPAPPVQTH